MMFVIMFAVASEETKAKVTGKFVNVSLNWCDMMLLLL